MRVLILHDRVTAADGPDGRDVLDQAAAVTGALTALGHTVDRLDCDLDLAALATELRQRQPELVFNLVESLGGSGRLIHLVPACLETLGVPYTGCRADALLLTSNKLLAKRWLQGAGLPVPAWVEPGDDDLPAGTADWIVKSVWEHASIGLDANSLVRGRAGRTVRELLPERARRLGGVCFAEHYIEGRECNLALLAGPCGPELLPPAEIVFDNFPPGMPRILDYRAKWDEQSFACSHTRRSFDFPPADGPLLARLEQLALACWRIFRLNGYARVDFRIDTTGAPWILEVNANPCLSPDAGFSAALERAGIPFDEAVRRIVVDSAVGT
jgi:D-alanine-D-alanine ligase